MPGNQGKIAAEVPLSLSPSLLINALEKVTEFVNFGLENVNNYAGHMRAFR